LYPVSRRRVSLDLNLSEDRFECTVNLGQMAGAFGHRDSSEALQANRPPGATMLGMDEGDDPNSNVVRLPRNLDASGRFLRKNGPCYICDHPTAYGYSGYHGRYGDEWIDKWFRPGVREAQAERLKSGAFLRGRVPDNNTLRQLMKFVCLSCRNDMNNRLWPEANERERAESQRWLADLHSREAQLNPFRLDYGVRLVILNDHQIEIRSEDCVIGVVDFDVRSFRLRVILGDAYVGTEVPHVWTGGPAAVEIDLHRGIEQMLRSRDAPGD
jgi:hypothetical protein